MNKLRKVAGNNYEITSINNSSKNYAIIHRPSKAYVTFGNRPNHVVIIEGNTPEPHRGKKIGTNLRALVTLYATFLGKRLYQTGYNAESLSKTRKARNTTGTATNDPTSTWILRERLGWRTSNKNKSISHFNAGANTTKLMNWLTSRGFRIPK
jgi:hypothetical protein